MEIDVNEEIINKYSTAQIIDWACHSLKAARGAVSRSEKDQFTFGSVMVSLAQVESVLTALSKKMNRADKTPNMV